MWSIGLHSTLEWLYWGADSQSVEGEKRDGVVGVAGGGGGAAAVLSIFYVLIG